ncbi:CynX/NimT family MFS transporter [Pelagibius sp. Alg239-R121]|uniref:MFS transporter n=1 Tax=Pelagibius sp. Alg239-R121 TaxID=2993448 RepID=UPI0024A60B72|nr:MFS transporter [Pelagibius sp. Alg239-R121]
MTTEKTHWPDVLIFLAGGIAVAMLIGKAPAALPVIRAGMGLSLFEAGLVVSIFTLIAGFGGVLAGSIADRFGPRRIAIFGMGLAALSSLAGSAATTALPLLVTRTGEGLGFFLTVVSIPPLLLRASQTRDRQKVMGIWSSYMPAGMGSMLLVSGLIVEDIGWPGVWQVTAAAIVIVAAAFAFTARKYPPENPSSDQPGHLAKKQPVTIAGTLVVVKRPGPLLLALGFGSYASQFFIISSFVPLILVEQAHWSVPAAGVAGAAVIIANLIGTLGSAWLLGRGISRASIVIATSLILAIAAVFVLNDSFPPMLRIGAAVCFSAFGGLIPGVLFAGVPVHVPSPNHVSSVNGLMLQGVAIGQLTGPAISSYVVEQTGNWSDALYVVLPLAALAVLAGFLIGRLEQ